MQIRPLEAVLLIFKPNRCSLRLTSVAYFRIILSIMDQRATNEAFEAATLGARIVALRNGRGWNQKELSRRAGLRQARLSLFETGAKRPNLQEFARLAAALGVTLDELWSGSSHAAAKALRLAFWQEVEDVASPEELAGLGRLLQVLLAGYRTVLSRAPSAQELRQPEDGR